MAFYIFGTWVFEIYKPIEKKKNDKIQANVDDFLAKLKQKNKGASELITEEEIEEENKKTKKAPELKIEQEIKEKEKKKPEETV